MTALRRVARNVDDLTPPYVHQDHTTSSSPLMKIDHGTWAGWEIWLEYSDGLRLPEHKSNLRAPDIKYPRYHAEVQVECQHEKDFAIMVAPPASNVREYKASARADGGWVRGRTVRRKREDSLRKIRILRDQYGHTKEGAVLKTLRFSKLGTFEETIGDAPPSEHLGCIDVYLEAGTAYLSNKPRGAVNGNTPTAAVDEKMKKVTLTSYVDGRVLKAVTPESRQERRRWSMAVDHSIPTIRLSFKYATRDSILAQNSIADHHRAISRAHPSEEHKPINPRRKRSTVEVAAPAEGSRKKARSTNMDTKPRVIDLSNAGNPSTVISLIDSDDEL